MVRHWPFIGTLDHFIGLVGDFIEPAGDLIVPLDESLEPRLEVKPRRGAFIRSLLSIIVTIDDVIGLRDAVIAVANVTNALLVEISVLDDSAIALPIAANAPLTASK